MNVSFNAVGKPLWFCQNHVRLHTGLAENMSSLISVLLKEGCVWTTRRSGLTVIVISFHQPVAIPAPLL